MSVGKDGAKGAAKKRGLGRGLEALLGPKAAAEAPPLQAMPGDVLRTLPIDAMVPGKFQPRRTMDDAKLEELASSIRAQGVIQPIVVREQLAAYAGPGQAVGHSHRIDFEQPARPLHAGAVRGDRRHRQVSRRAVPDH